MQRWQISIGTVDGGSREVTVEAPSEEAAVEAGEGFLDPGETLQGLIESPEPGVDNEHWAGDI